MKFFMRELMGMLLRGSVKTEEDKDEQRLEKMSFKQRRKHLQKNDCVLHITRGN